ncbi:MAG TPA: DUF1015 family protein [Limnochordales bacterium]
MPKVSLFAGIRYDPARVGDVGSLLADAADWRPAARRPTGEPAQLGGGPGTDTNEARPHASRLFSDWAGTVVSDWLARGLLVRDESPTLYLYEARRPVPEDRRHGPGVPETASYRAVVAALGVGDPAPPKRVETIDPAAVEPMVPVMKAFAVDVAPVWGLFAKAATGARRARLDEILAGTVEQGEPVLAIEAADGTSHRLWRMQVDAARELADILSQVPVAVVQGALQVEALRRLAAQSSDGQVNGTPPSVLAFLTPCDSPADAGETPAILPVHRLLLSSSRLDAASVEQRLAACFRLLDVGSQAESLTPLERVDAALAQLGKARDEFTGFVLYLGGGRVKVARSKGRMLMENWTHPLGRATWRAMDVNVLHALGFERALGIGPELSRLHAPPLDVETSVAGAIERVDRGEAVAAFLLPPPSPQQLLTVALDNNPIPADSVRPWPPIPAGLILRWRRPS